MQPDRVLDVGLGVSSTVIDTYFEYAKTSGEHTILEHDKKWVDFYCKSHKLSPFASIKYQKVIKRKLKDCTFDSYEQSILKDTLTGNKYYFISIDAPRGGKKYARRDLLPVIPEILDKSFVIVIDDADRIGEKKTILELKKSLNNRSQSLL